MRAIFLWQSFMAKHGTYWLHVQMKWRNSVIPDPLADSLTCRTRPLPTLKGVPIYFSMFLSGGVWACGSYVINLEIAIFLLIYFWVCYANYFLWTVKFPPICGSGVMANKFRTCSVFLGTCAFKKWLAKKKIRTCMDIFNFKGNQ